MKEDIKVISECLQESLMIWLNAKVWKESSCSSKSITKREITLRYLVIIVLFKLEEELENLEEKKKHERTIFFRSYVICFVNEEKFKSIFFK